MIINLAFVRGSSLRKMKIEGRVMDFISQETGGVPMKIDLNKMKDNKDHPLVSKLNDEQIQILQESFNLKDEEAIAKEIIDDFRRTGWRRIKKSDS